MLKSDMWLVATALDGPTSWSHCSFSFLPKSSSWATGTTPQRPHGGLGGFQPLSRVHTREHNTRSHVYLYLPFAAAPLIQALSLLSRGGPKARALHGPLPRQGGSQLGTVGYPGLGCVWYHPCLGCPGSTSVARCLALMNYLPTSTGCMPHPTGHCLGSSTGTCCLLQAACPDCPVLSPFSAAPRLMLSSQNHRKLSVIPPCLL